MTEQECLPTLLASRRKMRAAEHNINLKPLELSEDSMRADNTDFGVKNTFIDSSMPCSPSLVPFYKERQVRSCPSEQVGCLKTCFEDVGSVSTETPAVTPKSTRAALILATTTGEDMEHHCLWPATPCYDEHIAVPMVSYESIPAARGMATMQYQGWPWGDHYASPAPAFCNEVIGEPMVSSRKTVVCLSDVLCCEPNGSAQRCLAESAPLPTPVLSTDYKPVAVPIAPPPLSLAPGSAALPSIGSAAHGQGRCKPCAFFHTKGCEIGPACSFCHLCGADERKHRKKEKAEQRQDARESRKAAVAARR
eukprot:CAMPEP_0203966532 /NCGR_PEP_ID=MMETSP0359-20131031/95735_1 /ASSEMBLY_ACC=CAM_ASM_000338 /TAXON_ID=268821 /ORGANISM="Scrippsiella Hangoei, Strain SHTV-5" /LENGTH=307 /DNA_ID=CAMNT_0050903947 /DNA_START=74 /DNA_END=997 /DNA_ORIENTATION=+